MGRAKINKFSEERPSLRSGRKIRIQMMGSFALFVDERRTANLVANSKKGVSLMEYLIVNRGAPVSNGQLMNTLWGDEKCSNPENALKTLVSRLRSMLNLIEDGLGACIVADRGAYHWESIKGVCVDVLEILDIFDKFDSVVTSDFSPELYEELLRLYTGDLLSNEGVGDWVMPYSATLHNRYMSAVYAYIDQLKQQEKYAEITAVCRTALEVDSFDDRLNIELMTALINTNHTSNAMAQYKHVVQLNYKYLGIQPSENMQEFYKKIVRAGKTLDFSLSSIRDELQESGDQYGAFVCEYSVFKEIYNLQMRNLERLGSTMFLGLIMVGDQENPEMDSIRQDSIMNTTLDILRKNLRKGDTICHLSVNTFALLLPMVNFTTGNTIMERIKRFFYKRYPNSDVAFSYRIGPLSSGPDKKAEP